MPGIKDEAVEAKVTSQIHLPGESGRGTRPARRGRKSGGITIGQAGGRGFSLHGGTGGDAFVKRDIRAAERFVFRQLRMVDPRAEVFDAQPLAGKDAGRMGSGDHFIDPAIAGIRPVGADDRRPDRRGAHDRRISGKDGYSVIREPLRTAPTAIEKS